MDTQDRKRKHEVQARKSSDGTFELYVGENGEGLQEISEEEVSYVESVAPPEEVKERRSFPISPRVMVIAAVSFAVVALVAVGLSMWPDSSPEEELNFVAGELPAVKGFKPYGGSTASNTTSRRFNKPKTVSKKNPLKSVAMRDNSDNSDDESDTIEEEAEIEAVAEETGAEKPAGWDVKDAVAATQKVDEEEEGVIDESNDDSAEVDEDETEGDDDPGTRSIRALKPGFKKPTLGSPKQLNRLGKPNFEVVRGIQDIRDNEEEEVEAEE